MTAAAAAAKRCASVEDVCFKWGEYSGNRHHFVWCAERPSCSHNSAAVSTKAVAAAVATAAEATAKQTAAA